MPIRAVQNSAQPTAAGYICLDDEADSVYADLLKDIAACCLREGLRLRRSFVDRGYDGKQLARTGLNELRTALVEHDGLVVVVPTLDHLSPIEHIRSPLLLMIHRLGGRVVVAQEKAETNEPA